ncbi:MAG: hypothetical protein EOM24_29955 [Chloroflexia bacterium]|nr:hypothetical protein [Chloroflexia bacterium]
MTAADLKAYAEKNPSEWLAQLIHWAWDEEQIKEFADSCRTKEEFERTRDALNERYAAAQP